MQRSVVRHRLRKEVGFLVAAFLAAVVPLSAQTQTGAIVGRAVTAAGEPVPVVQVFVQGTGIGTLTAQDGSYTLANVPVGVHTIVAQRLGYQEFRRTDVTVGAGQTATLDLTMSQTVLALQGIVATGLVDPIEGLRSPITVARVSRESMPVTVAGSAVQNLAGRVAGVTMHRSSGQPGQESSIILRTPTSVMPPGEGGGAGGFPLIVVDGVVLGTQGTANIDALDIESIEVVKGASAASLYGSRASAGVISITTSRGQGIPIGQTQFTARSEFGISQLNRTIELPTHHQYLMDAAQTTYVDLNGNPVSRDQRVARVYSFMDNPFPGQTYDNLNTVFQAGSFQSNNFTVSGNTVDTNFAVTLSKYNEGGALENNEGYSRNSFRVNLDHRFLDGVALSTSTFHSRDLLDNVELSFTQVLLAPPDVDLRTRDENGEYLRIPDPQVAYENPLWVQSSREGDRRRVRTLANMNLRWDPVFWLSLMGNLSYDRQDTKSRTYLPKGTPTSLTADTESTGSLSYTTNQSDAWNAEAQASFRRTAGLVNARTTLRAIVEFTENEDVAASGTNFFVEGVPRINAAQVKNSSSSEEQVRSVGYLWDTALDYDEKYVASFLLRRDGSSLFGADRRWHWYYRTAFSWMVAAEDWFNVPNVSDLVLSYARGTAGGRPAFEHQYETWSVGATGVSKGVLGNSQLMPEHTLEQEVSLSTILYDRYSVEVNYAWQESTNQIVRAELPSFTGYSLQWANGGTLVGQTLELTVEAKVVERPNFVWTTTLVGDRSTGRITDWPLACFTVSYRYLCGEERNVSGGTYKYWAGLYLTGKHQLEDHNGGGAWEQRDEFMTNDDGFLVWVGPGGHYTQHEGKWGTATSINGYGYQWGFPIQLADANGSRRRSTFADASQIHLGSVNSFGIGQISLNAQVQAGLGGTAPAASLKNQARHPGMDQSAKPQELKKPIEYYQAQVPPGSANNMPLSFLKLRTLSANYRLNPTQITQLGLGNIGVKSLALGLVGRDLFTLTHFKWSDPEQTLDVQNRTGTAGGGYPSLRTLTAEVQVTF